MRRKLPIVIFIIFLFSLFPINVRQVSAFEEKVDQYCVVLSQAYVVIGNYGWNQTFTPKFNDMLTKVKVYLGNRTYGNSITITVKDLVQDTTIYSATKHQGDDGDGWEEFNLAVGTHPDGYEVVKGNKHSIYLTVGDTTTRWHRKGTDCEDDAERRQNDNEYSDDFLFNVWGYNTEEEPPEEEQPPEEEPPSEDEQQEENPNGEEETSQEELPITGEDEDEPVTKKASEINIETDNTVDAPALAYVEKNEDKISAPITDSIEVNDSDSLKIAGVAQANAKVLIFIGEDVYEVDVSSDGEWIVEIDVTKITKGEYLIEALTKISDTSGSEKTVLFPLSKLQVSSNVIDWPKAEAVEYTLWQKLTVGSLRYISMIILGLILIGLIVLLLIIVAKNEKKRKEHLSKKKEKKFEREDPKKESTFRQNLMQEAENKDDDSE